MLTPAQRAQIISIIDDVDDLTIATVRDDGYPQATIVSYVNDGLNIYFGTSANAQKARNIARCNKVSATINRPYNTWSEIESLSIGGLAHAIKAGDEMAKIGQLMLRKFPQIQEMVAGAGLGELALFRIEPQVVSILDYRRGFGHTELAQIA